MSELQAWSDSRPIAPPDDWEFGWLDQRHRVAQLRQGDRRTTLLVEGGGARAGLRVREDALRGVHGGHRHEGRVRR